MQNKHIAINTHLILWLVLILAFLGLSVGSAMDSEAGLCIAFAVLALVPLFVFLISPFCVVFDKNCVEIIYVLGAREQIRWGEIRNITRFGSWLGGGGSPHFAVAYRQAEKRPFFVRGEIPKTRKTEKLIRKYYKVEIL